MTIIKMMNPLCSSILSLVCLFGVVIGTNNFEIVGIERYESAIQLNHEKDDLQLQDIWNADIEERKKACWAALNAFNIKNFAYKPHSYQPEILQYNFLNEIQKPERRSPDFSEFLVNHSSDEQEEEAGEIEDEGEEEQEESVQPSSASFDTFAMYCGTLPSVYVRISTSQSENVSTKYLKAVLIESTFDPFQIRRKNEKPRAVRSDYSKEELGDNSLVELSLEDRRSLCITASENHSFTFFSNHVPEARVYDLEYSPGKKNTIIGVRCPVVPPIILHQEDGRLSHQLLNLTFIRTPVDEYNYGGFEVILMSRYEMKNQELLESSILSWDDQTEWSFCVFAEKQLPISKRNLFTIDNTRIGVARVYNFVYPNGTEANYVAVQCAEAPTVFVYLDESKKEVKVLVFSSTADKLKRSDPEPSGSGQPQLSFFT